MVAICFRGLTRGALGVVPCIPEDQPSADRQETRHHDTNTGDLEQSSPGGEGENRRSGSGQGHQRHGSRAKGRHRGHTVGNAGSAGRQTEVSVNQSAGKQTVKEARHENVMPARRAKEGADERPRQAGNARPGDQSLAQPVSRNQSEADRALRDQNDSRDNRQNGLGVDQGSRSF